MPLARTAEAASFRGLTPAVPRGGLRGALRWAWRTNPALTVLLVAMAGTALLGAAGMLLDPRRVLDAPTWAKTTKFSLSILLYSATWLWLLPYATRWPRLASATGWIVGVTLLVEMALIVFQGARARPMHFNVATPLESTLWTVMAVTIGVLFAFNLVGLGLLLWQRLPDPALAWGIRLGLLIMIVGLAEGYLMPGPKPDQQARLVAGQRVDLIGAHTVGAPDGGPGLPFTGWSTTHGDLRIGHFVGLHGMQAVPLLGWLLSARRRGALGRPWLGEGRRVLLVVTGAAGYLGLVLLLTWQALRGQPLLAPDGVTLGALGTLVAGIVGIALAIVLGAPRRAVAPVAPVAPVAA